jgi:hypothetical protein
MANILNNKEDSIEQWPPLRLVQLARTGSLIIACQFVVIALNQGLVLLYHHYFGPRLGLFATTARFCLLLAPTSIGTVLMVISYRWLSDGLDGIKWTDSEIEAAYQWADSHDFGRLAEWLLVSFAVAEIALSYLVFNVWKIPHHSATKLFFDSLALWCIPPLVMSDIKDRLRLALPKSAPSSSDSRRSARLTSEHWGEHESHH